MSRAPYKYLDYYKFEDADLFFGRESEVQRMLGEILSTRLLVLFSPSGSGKTSLINAGLRPALEQMGYKTIYVRPENDPTISVIDAVTEALELPKHKGQHNLYRFLVKAMKPRQDGNFDETQKPQPLVIFLDQFEEFFIIFRDKIKVREKFIDQLAKIKYDEQLPVFFVLSLRDDYFVNLHEFREAIPSIFHSHANIHLEPFSNKEARRAIKEPLKAVKGGIEKEVVDALIKNLKNGKSGIEPIILQIVCHTLWAQRTDGSAQITYKDYIKCGRAKKILKNHFTSLIRKIPWWQRRFMIRIFEALRTPDNTKRYRTFEDLQTTLKIKNRQRLQDMLDKLSNLQLLRFDKLAGTKWYEFKHDYLVYEVAKWLQKRKERIARNRFIYGVIPSSIIFLGIIVYLLFNLLNFKDSNKYYAAFSTTRSLVGPQAEIEISQARNPILDLFNDRDKIITTGFYKKDLRDPHTGIAIQKSELGWNEDDWNALVEKLNLVRASEFRYITGDSVARKAAVDSLKTALLEDQNKEIRLQALDVLKVFAEIQHDSHAITTLVEALRDTSNYTGLRAQAAEILGGIRISDNHECVITALINALNTDEKDLWVAADSALIKLGNQSNTLIIPILTDSLKNVNDRIRLGATKALVGIGWSDKAVITNLTNVVTKHDYGWVRSEAAGVLGSLGISDKKVIDSLMVALKDKNHEVRSKAAAALGMLTKKNGDEVISELVKMLEDGNGEVRSKAAGALVNLGQGGQSKKVIAELKDVLLNNKFSWVRSEAAAALGMLATKKDGAVISELVNVMFGKNKNYARYLATRTLGKLVKSDIDTLLRKSIIDTLKYARKREKYWRVRYEATKALVTLGKAEQPAIRYLVNVLKSAESTRLRSEAAETFKDIGKDTLEPAIERLVTNGLQRAAQKDNSQDVRSLAVEALGNLAIYDDIVALLRNDESEKVRSKAAEMLGNILKRDTLVINALKDALKDESPEVRSQVALAMGKLKSDLVVGSLIEALSDPNSVVRANAANALGQLDSVIVKRIATLRDDSVVVDLIETLKDSESEVRVQAATALGKLLRIKYKSENKLIEFLEDEQSGYRTAAAYALAQKDSLESETMEKIDKLRNKDKRPWVRLGAWEAYELIQSRNESKEIRGSFKDKRHVAEEKITHK